MTEEVLKHIPAEQHFKSTDELITALDERAQHSRTVKQWVDVLVKPVLLILNFVRTEREGNWLLHLATFKEIMPYCFATGHGNYAR